MRIYLNRKQRYMAWGGGIHFVNSIAKNANEFGHEIVGRNTLDVVNMLSGSGPEAILIVGLDSEVDHMSADDIVIHRMTCPDVKLVLRVNECDERKKTHGVDEKLLWLSENVDGTIFVSNWMRDYFMQKGWKCKNNAVIRNGVDESVFHPENPKSSSNKIRIVAHHWSDNRLKGADIYEKIDEFVKANSDRFEFTYIGRHRCRFTRSTKVIQPLFGDDLGEELRKHDVYVSASYADPGPNHILEAISSGLPTYVHKAGGGCVEFAGQDHVFNDWSALEKILLSGDYKPNDQTIIRPWRDCVKETLDFVSSI